MAINPIVELAKGSLLAFSIALQDDFQTPRHIKLISKKLSDVASGKIKRLMIFMPPRHGKSLLTSTMFPAWYLGNNPKDSVIFSSYSQDLASDFGRKVRNLMSEHRFSYIFRNLVVSEDSNSSRRFHTSKGGSYYAVGAMGPITGRGADIAIIDDIVKNRQDANSPIYRKRIQEWFTSTLYTRLSPKGAIVLVQTRWNVDDLPGWLLQTTKEHWDVLSLPAIDDNGDALWPERFSRERLLQIKDMSPRDFESLYQQRPTLREGNLIKRSQIKFYKTLPERLDSQVQSWDLSFSDSDDSAFTVGLNFGKLKGEYYLIDRIKDKANFTGQIQMIRSFSAKHPRSLTKLIEKKANGDAVINTLQREISGIISIIPTRSKELRMESCSPLFEAGNVYLPDPSIAPWVNDYIEELVNFPNSAYADQVDATSQVLNWFLEKSGGNFTDQMTEVEYSGAIDYNTGTDSW